MPVVEYVSFLATDTYITDRTTFRSGFDKVLKAKGCISVWNGMHDDGKTGQWVIVWETHEAHKALVDSAGYADLFVELKGTMVGGFDMQHVPYDSDLLNILSAPVTEIFVLHLRPTAMKEELFPVLSRLAEEIDKEEDSFPPSVFGGSLDNGGIVIITVGWKSRAASEKATETEWYQRIIAETRVMVDITLAHTTLTRHLL